MLSKREAGVYNKLRQSDRPLMASEWKVTPKIREKLQKMGYIRVWKEGRKIMSEATPINERHNYNAHHQREEPKREKTQHARPKQYKKIPFTLWKERDKSRFVSLGMLGEPRHNNCPNERSNAQRARDYIARKYGFTSWSEVRQ